MTVTRQAHRAAAILIVIALAGCGSTARPRPTTSPAVEAVRAWLTHLERHDDAAAFADLAPRSRAAVGDLDNYRRGSGRFGPVYDRYARGRVGDPLSLSSTTVVVPLGVDDPVPAVAAVPVRRIGTSWRVDPLGDVGSYSFRPDDGATVGPNPSVNVQIDDPATQASIWFDDQPARGDGATFRPRSSLAPGWHTVTVALVRGEDVVARAFRLRVTVAAAQARP